MLEIQTLRSKNFGLEAREQHCRAVTALVFAPDRGSQVRIRLAAGGRRIRTLSPGWQASRYRHVMPWIVDRRHYVPSAAAIACPAPPRTALSFAQGLERNLLWQRRSAVTRA